MRPTLRYVVTTALAGATVLLAALPKLPLPAECASAPALRFLGRLHLVGLHFPVVLVPVALLLALRALRFPVLRRVVPEVPRALATIFIGAAALSAALAALAGWLLAQSGGSHEAALLQLHLWTGSGVAATAMLAWTLQLANAPDSPRRGRAEKLAAAVLASSALLLVPAGHAGGGLTHGEEFLGAYAPRWLRPWLGARDAKSATGNIAVPANSTPPAAVAGPGTGAGETQLVFRDVVYPVLERHCVSCHGETKTKGGLRVDTREAILRGGKNPPAVVPGNTKESPLLGRIHLPLDDDKHMPPDDPDREQPTPEELALLGWWVAAGLPGNVPVTEIVVPQPPAKPAAPAP